MDLEREKWPDPVRRIKDTMDMHAVGKGVGYVVFSLQDGKPLSRNTFPSRAAARTAGEKKTQDHLLILEVSPDGMPYREADACLRYERALISAGYRSPDSLETEENSGLLSMPRMPTDRKRMARQLLTGKPETPDDVPYGNLPYFLRKAN
jgi:hypothetical protein